MNILKRKFELSFNNLYECFKYQISKSFLHEMYIMIINIYSDEKLSNYFVMPEMQGFSINGVNENVDYEICRHICGCHTHNTMFLSKTEKEKLENSKEYRIKLIDQFREQI